MRSGEVEEDQAMTQPLLAGVGYVWREMSGEVEAGRSGW